MQTVSVGEQRLLIKPRRLINYIEKVNYIRSRRPGVWDLLKQLPRTFQADTYQSFVREAMSVVHASQTVVSIEEELNFDNSAEGFFWTLWKCMPASGGKKQQKRTFFEGESQQSDDPSIQGIQQAKILWESATDDEKQQIRLALNAVEQRIKNSDGPPSSETTGRHPSSENPSQ